MGRGTRAAFRLEVTSATVPASPGVTRRQGRRAELPHRNDDGSTYRGLGESEASRRGWPRSSRRLRGTPGVSATNGDDAHECRLHRDHGTFVGMKIQRSRPIASHVREMLLLTLLYSLNSDRSLVTRARINPRVPLAPARVRGAVSFGFRGRSRGLRSGESGTGRRDSRWRSSR